MSAKYVFGHKIFWSLYGSAFLSEFSQKESLKYNDVLSAVFTVVSDLAIQSFEDLDLVLWKYHAWFQY